MKILVPNKYGEYQNWESIFLFCFTEGPKIEGHDENKAIPLSQHLSKTYDVRSRREMLISLINNRTIRMIQLRKYFVKISNRNWS